MNHQGSSKRRTLPTSECGKQSLVHIREQRTITLRAKKDVSLARGRRSENNCPTTLPKMLPGAVCEQWVRCGRANCRCARGEKHGPYFFRFWREDGRLRKQYIKRPDVDRVRAECEERRSEARLEKQILDELWNESRAMSKVLRELERR